MRKSQVMTTVSAIALAAAALPMSAVFDNPARGEVTIDWSFTAVPDVVISNTAIGIPTELEQINKGVVAATVDNTIISNPPVGIQDYGDGVDAVIVDLNDATSMAIGTKGVNFIGLNVVSGADGAVAGSAEINRGATSIDALVSGTDIRLAGEDSGAGSSYSTDLNLIEATTIGNLADNTISGNVNPLLISGEDGLANIGQGANEFLEATATLMVANMQINEELDSFTAGVDTSRIGSLALAIDNAAIKGMPLSVEANEISAGITGNDADNLLSITDDKDVVLNATAGVINAQLNDDGAGALVIKASVLSSDIEAGDTTVIDEPIDALVGSSIDFSDNDIGAAATASTATNVLEIDGVTIQGNFTPAGSNDFTVNTNAGNAEGHTRALGDIYVASLQYDEASVTATVGGAPGDADDGDLNVLVEDVTGSTVQAGDTKLLGKFDDGIFDGNTITTSARGNVVTNLIDVSGVATYSALTALGSTQNTGSGNQHVASTNGDMQVSVATMGGSTGLITGSSVVADGNVLSSTSVTNTGNNEIAIDATTITGPGINPDEVNLGFMSRSWHTNLVASATTDIALVSNQHTISGTETSAVTGSFIVDAADVGGAVGSIVTDSSVSASGNTASALTVGNAIGENTIEIADTATFDASVALVSFQLAQDGSTKADLIMSATVAPSDDDIVNKDIAIVDVTSSAVTTVDSHFFVNENSISAEVYGNLVAGGTNTISIDGVTVGDNDMGARTAAGSKAGEVKIGAIEAQVDRDIAGDGLPQTTVNSGFSLISDQSFEDSGINPVIASIQGSIIGEDSIDVSIGSTDLAAVVSDVDVSVNDNDLTARVRLNTSSNALKIGQNAPVQTLDANVTLVNTQTFWDELNAGDGAGLIQVDIFDAEIDVQVDAGATTIDALNVAANGNAVTAEARISSAVNSVAVSAQTQVVTDIVAGADVQSVNIGIGTNTGDGKNVVRSEVGLLNDQDFSGLMDGGDIADSGVSAEIDESDIWVTVTTDDGSLTNSTAEADGNSFRALALGNVAVNSLSLDIGTVDLSGALIGGGAGNAPLAIISNAQRGSHADDAEAGFWAEVDDNYISVNLASIDNDITNVQASVDGNSIEATARVNNGKNVLDVTGGTYEQAAATTPLVQALNLTGGGDVAAEDLAFGIASYQYNGYDVEAFGEDTDLSVYAGEDGTSIEASSFSVSYDAFQIQARSNDNINDASVTFTTNNVSAFAANVQRPGADTVEVLATGEDIQFLVSGEDTTADDTSVDVDGNNLSVIGTVNRALFNALSVDGTNLFSGTGTTTPAATIDPNVGGNVSVVSDASVLNVQGEDSVGSGYDEVVDVLLDENDFYAAFDVFNSGSISIDNNSVLGQGIIHSASNLLGMGATYTYDEGTGGISVASGNAANIEATASIISQQIVTDDSEVTVRGEDTDLRIFGEDISSTEAVSFSVSNNKLTNQAIGGTVLNRMDVIASASITGVVAAPTPEMGDLTAGNPITSNADFNIVNYQAGEPEVFAQGEDTDLGIEIDSDADGDALTVSGNKLETSATGFNASNVLVLNAKAASDVTAAVLNRQDIANATVEAVQEDDIQLYIESDGFGANTSSLRLEDNVVTSTANGNVALNALSTTAVASLQQSTGAGITIDPDAAVVMAPTGSDYTVLNYQTMVDASSISEVDDVSIYVDDFSGATGINSSAVSVSDNSVKAASTGSSAQNFLVLNTNTFQHPTATVGNLQLNSGATITATVTNVSIGIGNGGGNITDSSNSSFTVRGNSVGATAIGASAVNSITGD
ncbi:MAG: beta strand repeat-containing protein [Sphingomonadales bacterium]